MPISMNSWRRGLEQLSFIKSAGTNGNSKTNGTKHLQLIRRSGSINGKSGLMANRGEFCPNKGCSDYGKPQSEIQKNIIKSGKSKKGVQRYLCKSCNRSFLETVGTIFYRKRTPENEILEVLALIAKGETLDDISREKSFAKDTMIQWLQEAVQHPVPVKKMLVNNFEVKPEQLEALWTSALKWNRNGKTD